MQCCVISVERTAKLLVSVMWYDNNVVLFCRTTKETWVWLSFTGSWMRGQRRPCTLHSRIRGHTRSARRDWRNWTWSISRVVFSRHGGICSLHFMFLCLAWLMEFTDCFGQLMWVCNSYTMVFCGRPFAWYVNNRASRPLPTYVCK